MMRLLVALMVIGSALGTEAGSQGTASIDALAGKWKSTVVPPKGEVPMVAPEMTVETKGNAVTVTMGPKGSPVAATAFDGGKGVVFLLLKMGMGGGMATIVVRPADAGRVRVEYFVEFPSGSRNRSYYYSEVFAREK